jgi:mannitol-1-phosphate 5-dehydrogenase
MSLSAVMFGSGNVGRGFLGQLFSESGYEVVFVDVDAVLVKALDEAQSYTIRLVENERTEEVLVQPVRAFMASQIEEVSAALASANIAATAVGARALAHIAPLIAAGITRRARSGDTTPLNIIVCENLHGAAEHLRGLVAAHIPEDAVFCFQNCIGFVDTVIGRMVPPPTPEMRAEDPRLIAVEPYKELPVDRAAFIGSIPEIVGMQASDNFGVFTARKLYIHNCGHAVLAYLGYLRKYEYGYQALVDPVIRPLLEKALAESQAGIVAEYHVDPAWLDAHRTDLLRRFANRALGDTIFRLGRDPIRKLAPSDRLVAPARLAEKSGVQPRHLSIAIAAALRFADPHDPIAVELQQKIASHGIEATLANVCQILPGEPLSLLVQQAFHELDSILQQ